MNLKHGIPVNSFNHTCTSGAGTLLLEFAMLGALLNESVYEQVARNSVHSIFERRNNETGLLGNELHIHTGEWLGVMSGLGAGLDSFYEYLLKVFFISPFSLLLFYFTILYCMDCRVLLCLVTSSTM